MTAKEAQTLSLRETHRGNGASFYSVLGWELPSQFAGLEQEYQAATEKAALLDAGFLSITAARGKDHIDYLNRRLSQRVLSMDVGEGLRANQLAGDGKMEADLEIYTTGQEESLLMAPPGITGPDFRALMDKYVFSEKAAFEDQTSQWGAFTLLGPLAEEILQTLGFQLPEPGKRLIACEWQGGEACLLRSAFLLDAWTILIAKDWEKRLYETLLEEVSRHGGLPLGFEAFNALRIEAGVPWFGLDLTRESNPLDADLLDAIHTDKGCYPGQEALARILNLGHPAKKLMGVQFEGSEIPDSGQEVRVDGSTAGKLTSSAFSPSAGAPIGLAMMRWAHRQPGTSIQTASGHQGQLVEFPPG